MRQVPIGHRIRSRRQELRLTQTGLAQKIGISASYLNLIEHNRRAIGGGLLRRLAQELDLEMERLSGGEESRLLAELSEIAADPLFAASPLDLADAPELIGRHADLARALLTLYRTYRDARQQAEMLSERLSQDPFLAEASHQILTLITSIRSFSEILEDHGDLAPAQRQRFITAMASESQRLSDFATNMFDFINGKGARSPQPSPSEEVDDFIYDHDNHYGDLEDAAETLRKRLRRRSGTLADALAAHLAQQHGVSIRYRAAQQMPEPGYRYDAEARRLDLSEVLPEPSARFQIARLAARLEADEAIDALTDSSSLTTEEARARCRGALASYYAGALIFPYREFRETATAVRHDIGILQQRFGGSFEQICHRLTTLRRPGEEGIPFHFVRTDIAGNLSKRFSASGLRLPRYGGACPRWALYEAFLQPGQIVRQLASMPDGTTYLFIAATVSKPAAAYGAPASHHAIMIGCDASAARHVVYGDGLDPTVKSLLTPVGVSCRQCPRENCAQRAFAHLTGAEQGPDARLGV